tara:strand:+ start:145116 stop:146141 length:1026 start_codon:yes stop_codon:yes gene_type:complete
MNFEPTLSPRFVAYVRDYLMDRGVDPDPVFEQCGIALMQSQEFDTPVPVRQVAALIEIAGAVTDNPCIGMNMAQSYHYEASSILIVGMMAAPTVEEGLKCLNRFDKYVDTAIETTFNFEQSVAEFSARLICDDNVKVQQLNEYLMVFLARTLHVATRQKLPVEEVWLSHAGDQNAAVMEAFFGVPVKFGKPFNKLFFDRSYLKVNCFTSNALLYEVVTSALKTYFLPVTGHASFIDRVAREIISCAEGEPDSAERIAERLAMSPRTLRRHLSEEGYSFQAAKNLAREKHAKYFLSHTSLSLSEIAFKLGYSELSAFSRAFRGWTDLTPQNYREQTRKLFMA